MGTITKINILNYNMLHQAPSSSSLQLDSPIISLLLLELEPPPSFQIEVVLV